MKRLFLPIAILSMFFFASCGGGEGTDEGTTPEKTPEEIEMERKLATVPEKAMGNYIKHTGTNCYYCGTWGWTGMEYGIAQLSDDAVIIGAFGQHSFARDFISKYSTELDGYYKITGYPTFTANGDKLAPAGTTLEQVAQGLVDEARNKYLIAQDGGVDAGGAVKWSVADNRATVDARFKFYKDCSGTYLGTVWLDESGMQAAQAGYTGGIPSHHHALRAAATTSVFGEEIASGDILKDNLVEKSWEVEFPEGLWKKENVEASVIIFKKIGTAYIFVNGSKTTFTE